MFEDDCPDFAKLAKRESCARKRVRLIALAQLKAGKAIGRVATSLGIDRHSIGTWYANYKKSGLAGLEDKPRSGPLPKIPKDREKEFMEKIEYMQATRKGGRVTGYDIQEMALKNFGAAYAENSIYSTLHRLNVVWISARSKHPKSDEEAQEKFKKDFKKKSVKSYQRPSI